MVNSSNKRMYAIIAAVIVIAIAIVLLLNSLNTNGRGAKGTEAKAAAEQSNDTGANAAVKPADQTAIAEEEPTVSGEAAEPAAEPAIAEEPPETLVQTDIPSLAETYADYFPIGAAIEPFQITGLKAELLKKHVNWLVAENVMKPDAIQPAEGNFTWGMRTRLSNSRRQTAWRYVFIPSSGTTRLGPGSSRISKASRWSTRPIRRRAKRTRSCC